MVLSHNQKVIVWNNKNRHSCEGIIYRIEEANSFYVAFNNNHCTMCKGDEIDIEAPIANDAVYVSTGIIRSKSKEDKNLYKIFSIKDFTRFQRRISPRIPVNINAVISNAPSENPIDDLPKYGWILDISRDGLLLGVAWEIKIESSIMLNFKLRLNDSYFPINVIGKIVREHDPNKKDLIPYKYGIRFNEPLAEYDRLLS